MESRVKVNIQPMAHFRGWEILLQVFPPNQPAGHAIYLAQCTGDGYATALREARDVLTAALGIVTNAAIEYAEQNAEDDD